MKNILSIILITIGGFLQAYAQEFEETATPEKSNMGKVELGFGIVHDRNLSTASTATVGSDELEQRAAINLNDALYGRLLGLTALKQSGSDGGWVGGTYFGASYNVRGIQTLTGETGIIILVDGFPRDIDRISVDEIESVTVLKDAAALALYGYTGVNGAIYVKTKRGLSAGSGLKINTKYHHKFTFASKLPEYVDAYTYAQAMNEARRNYGNVPTYNSFELNAFKDGLYPGMYPNINWKDEALRNTGSEDVFSLSVSNRNEKLSFFSLLNYTNSQGLLKGSEENMETGGYSTQLKYSKANVRTNLDVQLTSSTKFEAGISGIIYETNRPSGITPNDLFVTLNCLPSGVFPVKTDDGLWGGSYTFNTIGLFNPVARIQQSGYYRGLGTVLNADFKLTQSFDDYVKGLSVSGRFGYDVYNLAFENRNRAYSWANERYQFNIYGERTGEIIREEDFQTQTQLTFNRGGNNQSIISSRSLNLVLSADYQRQFDQHNLAASLIYHYNNSVALGRYNTFYRANIMGYLHYDLSGKYVADAVLTYTGSNRSYPQSWSFSPTLSLGWVISEEGFLQGNDFVSLLKLRGSYGMLHSDNVPRNGSIWMNIYDGGGGMFFTNPEGGFGGSWGRQLVYMPTTDFKLETAHKFNLGLDVLLMNSLGLTVEAYYQRRDNILMYEGGLYSSMAGVGAGYSNSGVVDSKGLELGLNYNNRFGNLLVNLGGMFTYSVNTIIDCVEEPKAYEWLEMKGKPVDRPRGLEHIGFFRDQNDIDNSPSQEFSQVRPGDVKYKVQKGDNTVNDYDYVPIGYSTSVPIINYAFNAGLEFKGIGVNILFQGAAQFNRWDYQRLWVSDMTLLPLGQGRNIPVEYYENRWVPGFDNSDAKYPALATDHNPNNEQNSTLWLKNASFLKLRHAEIYYRLPESMLTKIKYISGLKLSVRGENLYTWTPFNGIDPELHDIMYYPSLKGVSVGLSISF